MIMIQEVFETYLGLEPSLESPYISSRMGEQPYRVRRVGGARVRLCCLLCSISGTNSGIR